MEQPKDYVFFGHAVTQTEFAALMRTVVQDKTCPFCGKPAYVRIGLIAHAKYCKMIPKERRKHHGKVESNTKEL